MCVTARRLLPSYGYPVSVKGTLWDAATVVIPAKRGRLPALAFTTGLRVLALRCAAPLDPDGDPARRAPGRRDGPARKELVP